MQQCNKINLRTKKPEIAVFRSGQMRHVQHVESADKCCTCGQMLHLRTNVAAITILNKQQVLTNRDKQCESRNNHKGVHCVDLGESFPTHSNACLLAKVGFDTPENEPFEVRQLDNWVRPKHRIADTVIFFEGTWDVGTDERALHQIIKMGNVCGHVAESGRRPRAAAR